MAKQPVTRYSAANYLAMERASSEKHEFAYGEIFAMGGASAHHVIIVNNMVRVFGNAFLHRPCQVYSNDLRLSVDAKQRYTYPDIVVVCGQPQFVDNQFDTLVNPELIVEVLSDSTKNYDRGEKFEEYRRIESFCEYVIVDQTRVHVERWTKRSEDTWVLWETNSLDAVVQLDSVGVALPVSDIYFKIDFAAETV